MARSARGCAPRPRRAPSPALTVAALLTLAAMLPACRRGDDAPADTPNAVVIGTAAADTVGPAAARGDVVLRLPGAPGTGVLGLALLGDQLVSSGTDSVVRLWDLTRRVEVARLGGRAVATALAASGDGRLVLAQDSGGGVAVWRVADRARVRHLAGVGELAQLALAPQGDVAAAVGPGGAVGVWRVGDGERVARVSPHAGRYVALALAPGVGGPALLSVGADERLCVTTLAPSASAPRCTDAPSDGLSSAAFSADGRLAATGSRHGAVRLWDVASGRLLGRHEAHAGEVVALAFTRDARRLVTGGADRAATVLDAATGRRLGRIETPGSYVSAVAVSPDGAQAVVGTDDGTVLRWPLPR